MICPKCQFQQALGNGECLRCGIIFEKYKGFRDADPKTGQEPPTTPPESSPAETAEPMEESSLFKDILFHEETLVNPFYFGGRILLFLIILIWGWIFILTPMESNSVGNSFWHLVNLPFHEAGHIFFRPLGRFMTSLGGSLGQLIMPLVCLGVFLLKTKDTFAAAFSLWWFGQNFMDLAPYINDARALQLPLLGGNTGRTSPYGFHDWEFILTETKMLRHDHTLANLSHALGIIVMLIAFAWGGYILFRQYKNLDV
jgi:hypothetical protein